MWNLWNKGAFTKETLRKYFIEKLYHDEKRIVSIAAYPKHKQWFGVKTNIKFWVEFQDFSYKNEKYNLNFIIEKIIGLFFFKVSR